MLEIQALKFEKLFNRVIEMHITMDNLKSHHASVMEIEDQDLKYRVLVAFGKAFEEGRIVVHKGDEVIRMEKK